MYKALGKKGKNEMLITTWGCRPGNVSVAIKKNGKFEKGARKAVLDANGEVDMEATAKRLEAEL